MKAQHRHELQTNALADRMGKLIQGVTKGPPSNRTIGTGIVILAVVVAGLWYFSSGSTGWAVYWRELDGQTDPEMLKGIADKAAGTMPGRTARFQRARVLLQQGLHGMYAADRSQAVRDLEDARRIYLELEPECQAHEAILKQEALMGAAKAEETLVGVPKEGSPGETLGSLDRARELYRKLAETYPQTFLGEQAASHLKQLDEKGADVTRFYSEWSKVTEGKKK
jgi:hypothetical protein